MAMGNLNKSKETTETATTALKLPRGPLSTKIKIPLFDQNSLKKSTSKCEDCAARHLIGNSF